MKSLLIMLLLTFAIFVRGQSIKKMRSDIDQLAENCRQLNMQVLSNERNRILDNRELRFHNVLLIEIRVQLDSLIRVLRAMQGNTLDPTLGRNKVRSQFFKTWEVPWPLFDCPQESISQSPQISQYAQVVYWTNPDTDYSMGVHTRQDVLLHDSSCPYKY